MLRLSINELSTFRWSFEEDVLHYHQSGFEAIGVWLPKLSEYGEEKGAELIREHGLKISSLQWAGGFTGSDGRSFRQSMHDSLDTIQLAADLGAETVVVIAGGRGGHTRNHASRILRLALRELSEAAQAVGVELALEPMHIGCSLEWSFLNTIPQCLDIIANIARPNLGIVFDCYHLAQDPSILSWLDSIVPYVKLVQLGDAKHSPVGQQNRCLLGEGHIPLSSIVHTFQSHGYNGFYELELIGQEVENLKYEQILGHTKKVAALWQTAVTGSKN
ncbi:MAG: sugar phosphate isomerase/epimerase [Planctomycetales bacterium]|nr:sugar phosphate isomerase/epimerase [Planctomycetales bacterium]